MKIGIITFQRAHNFGAQMQMYALYSLLKNCGHEVYILDYHNPVVEDIYIKKHVEFRRIPRFITSLIRGYQRRKIRAFDEFLVSHFDLTLRFENPVDMPFDFDLLITGSDQLWDYKITGGRKEPYFLDNKKNNEKTPRKISYAISAEGRHYNDLISDKDYVIRAISGFSWISVREESLALMLKKEMNILADVVCDPTLFLSREDCLKMAVRPRESKYLCVYRVNKTSYLIELAKRIAKERGLKIKYVYASLFAQKKCESYGPQEIMGYLCYADVVLTSSFHGTVFSILNHKDFYSAYDAPSSRVQSLLDRFGYSNRFLQSIDDYDHFTSIDYGDEKLSEFASQSKAKLLSVIER